MAVAEKELTAEGIDREAADLAQIADIAFPDGLTRAQRAMAQRAIAGSIAFRLRELESRAEERGAAREREACAETAREYFKREYSFFKPTSADRLADVILARSHTKESQ